MCVFCLHIYLRTTCMPSVHGAQQRALDLLKLEIEWPVVSGYVGAGNLNPLEEYLMLLLSHVSSPCAFLNFQKYVLVILTIYENVHICADALGGGRH